jgi:hypothetical protein
MSRFSFGFLYAAAVLTGLVVAGRAARAVSPPDEPGPAPPLPPRRMFAPSTATIH